MEQNADSVPVVTFSTNLAAAQGIVAALDKVLAPHAATLDPDDDVILLSALRYSFASSVKEAQA